MTAGRDDPLFTLVFEGSEVGGIVATVGALDIAFSAARVRLAAPEPTHAVREGHARSLVMRLAGVVSPAPGPGTLIGGLAGGHIEAGGRRLHRVDIPSQIDGPCRIELQFLGGDALSVSARSVALRFTAEPRFSDDFSC